MNLFALTSNPAARVVRFPLSSDLQNEIRDVFLAQRKAFLDGIVDTIEFDGRYRPEEGELLVIRDFVDPDSLADIVKNPIGVEQFDPNLHSLESVKAIFAGCPDGSDQVLIQLFEQRRLYAIEILNGAIAVSASNSRTNRPSILYPLNLYLSINATRCAWCAAKAARR